jgi:hypothetical protein
MKYFYSINTFNHLIQFIIFTLFKKKKKKIFNFFIFFNIINNFSYLMYHIFILNFFFQICFFSKKINISHFNIINFTQIQSRKNIITLFRNNRKKVLKGVYLYLIKKKKIRIIQSYLFKKKTMKKIFLTHIILKDYNPDKISIFLNSNRKKSLYKFLKNLYVLNQTNFFKKFNKFILFNFFFRTLNNIKFIVNPNREKILLYFVENLDILIYSYDFFRKNILDSFVNVKIYNKKDLKNFFYAFFKKNEKIKYNPTKVNKNEIYSHSINWFDLKNLSKILTLNRYLLLNFKILKLIFRKTTLLIKKEFFFNFHFLIFILYSLNTNFNNFIFLFIFKLLNSKLLKKKKNLLFIIYYFFSNGIAKKYKKVTKFSKYLTIIFLFSNKWYRKEKIAYFLFSYLGKISENLINLNQKKIAIFAKILSYLHLYNIINNKFHLKTKDKKEKFFFFIKCNLCTLIIFKRFLLATYINFFLKKKIYYFFKFNLIVNLIKLRYNYKIVKLLFLLINQIIFKKFKTQKIKNISKYFLKIVTPIMKFLIEHSKFHFKKLIYWIENKLISDYFLIFFLFLIDNNIFFKFICKKKTLNTFFFSEKFSFNKIQRLLLLIFLEKINVFLGSEYIIFNNENFLNNFLINYSNYCSLLGPNRSHIFKKNNIRLVQKKIIKLRFLEVANDLIKIIAVGNSSRLINLYFIKNLFSKKKIKKNEYFHVRDLFENFNFSLNNVFWMKYFFFSFKFFFFKDLTSFKEMFDKFFYLSSFVTTNYTNKDIVIFFHQINQNDFKKTCINFQNGLTLIFQYRFIFFEKFPYQEKFLKIKCLKNFKAWFNIFGKIFLNNQKNNFNYHMLKIFFIILIFEYFFKKNICIYQEIIVLLTDFLNVFKINYNNYKKLITICEKIQNCIEIILKKKIKTIINRKQSKFYFGKWMYLCNLLILKVFINFFIKYKINYLKTKNLTICFKEILDISELAFISITNWKRKVKNVIKITKIFKKF